MAEDERAAVATNGGDGVIAWLRVDEAAGRARCGEKVIYRACKSRKLRCAKSGNKLVFKPEWVDAWLEATAQPVEAR
jgi:excisionase family DNA binding protein